MKVYLANAYPEMPRSNIPLARELAARDRFGKHALVEQPEAADIIFSSMPGWISTSGSCVVCGGIRSCADFQSVA
jgi:hypothetical protein